VSFFRDEVHAYRRARLQGAVLLTQPLHVRLLVGLLCILTVALGAWVLLSRYEQLEILSGVVQEDRRVPLPPGTAFFATLYGPPEAIDRLERSKRLAMEFGRGKAAPVEVRLLATPDDTLARGLPGPSGSAPPIKGVKVALPAQVLGQDGKVLTLSHGLTVRAQIKLGAAPLRNLFREDAR
jgi:hypothetical protein